MWHPVVRAPVGVVGTCWCMEVIAGTRCCEARLRLCCAGSISGFIIDTDVMLAFGYAGKSGALEAWIGFIIATMLCTPSALLA